jgi:hypothetical protein
VSDVCNIYVTHILPCGLQMHIDRMKDKPDECMTQEEVLINAPLLTRAHEIMEEGSEYQ